MARGHNPSGPRDRIRSRSLATRAALADNRARVAGCACECPLCRAGDGKAGPRDEMRLTVVPFAVSAGTSSPDHPSGSENRSGCTAGDNALLDRLLERGTHYVVCGRSYGTRHQKEGGDNWRRSPSPLVDMLPDERHARLRMQPGYSTDQRFLIDRERIHRSHVERRLPVITQNEYGVRTTVRPKG